MSDYLPDHVTLDVVFGHQALHKLHVSPPSYLIELRVDPFGLSEKM